jgi:hypothetical protein
MLNIGKTSVIQLILKELFNAQMAEMVDALDQGSSAKRFEGSSPSLGTISIALSRSC